MKKRALALVLVVVAVVLVLYLRRADDRGAAGAATPPAVARERDSSAPPTPRVKRLEDLSRRTTLQREILAARAARERASGTTARGEAPSLPDAEDPVIDKQYIRAAIRKIVPLLQHCYEEALVENPALAGTVAVNFTIEGEPNVGGIIGRSEVDEERSTLPDAGVRDCIRDAMFALELDPPADGGIISVSYPFTFRPVASPPAIGGS